MNDRIEFLLYGLVFGWFAHEAWVIARHNLLADAVNVVEARRRQGDFAVEIHDTKRCLCVLCVMARGETPTPTRSPEPSSS